MREVVRYLELYWLFLKQRLKILMEYRASFLIGATSTIAQQTAGLLSVYVVMQQIPTLRGWNFDEILLTYGLLLIARSLNHMFADNLWTLGRQYIRTGGFDRFLVRPIDPLFHLLADRFCQDGLGYFLVGVGLVVRSIITLHISVTSLLVGYIILSALSGGLIFFALNLITATSAFWLMDSIPVTRLVFDNNEFAKYPITIYPQFFRVALTWLIPYAFASFYPASVMLGRDIGVLAWLGPLVAITLTLIAYRVWRFGLRHYSGTGS
ncbi:MAG: ABC-2 family transporter protein [Anaerolineae bacterium]|nr:ABC-2 family transporter protein [Anaerolineae bacterium]